MKKLSKLLIALLLFGMAVALAQIETEVEAFDPELYEPLGTVDYVYEPYEGVEGGAIVLSATTPTDQEPNFDVVGPDAYYEHFDIEDDLGEETILEGLLPGVYSIASSDEGLQLAATLVEVRAGEIVTVSFNLQPMETFAYDIADYSPYAYGYPAGYNTLGAYSPYANDQFGSVAITSEFTDAEIVVTGPNGYSTDFEGEAVLDDLLPGTYVVAATDEGYGTSRNVFEVRAGERFEFAPTLLTVEEVMQEQGVEEEAVEEEADVSDNTITEIVLATPEFSTLAQALEATNLVDYFNEVGPFTFFAPTDEAFAALPEEDLNALLNDPTQLQDILMYHVTSGEIYNADLAEGTITMQNEGTLQVVSEDGTRFLIGDAGLVTADIDASNGVIHAIDTVLLPNQ